MSSSEERKYEIFVRKVKNYNVSPSQDLVTLFNDCYQYAKYYTDKINTSHYINPDIVTGFLLEECTKNGFTNVTDIQVTVIDDYIEKVLIDAAEMNADQYSEIPEFLPEDLKVEIEEMSDQERENLINLAIRDLKAEDKSVYDTTFYQYYTEKLEPYIRKYI